jgi:Sec-independent protein translocase protein TatA
VSTEPRNRRKILFYRPAQVWLVAAVVLVLLVGAGYQLFEQGMRHAGVALDRFTRQQAGLQQQLQEERSLTADLRQQLAIQQRSSEIDRRASLEVRDEFSTLQAELQKLRKELAFYRGIVSPADNTAGVRIQSFDLQPQTTAGRYVYKLMLTQVKRNDRYVNGVIEIEVEGLQDGKRKVWPFADLRVDKGKELAFRFRYFQHFEGEIELPSNVKPQRVTIRVKTTGTNQPPDVEKTMDWPD